MPSTPTHSLLKPHGHIFINDPDLPRLVEMDTLKCVHCQAVLIYRKGSGGKLGHCDRCAGPTCGNDKCTRECLHWERALDLYEAGKIDSL